MENFYLTPESIPILAKLILAIIVTGYLSLAPKSTKAIYWFNGYLIGYTALDLFAFLGIVFKTDWATLGLPFQYFSSLVFTFCYLQFAYLYKVNLFQKEHRIVTLITSFVGLGGIIFAIYQLFKIGYGDYTVIQNLLPYPLLLITWSAIVLYRKYRFAVNNDSADPVSIKAYKSFYIITFIAILISISPALWVLNLISSTVFTVVFFVLNLAVFTLITAAALNYLLEKTTVLVKLVGISLVLFVTIIGLQGFLVVPDYQIPKEEVITTEQRKEIHDQVLPYVFFLFGSSAIIMLLFPVFYNRSVLMPLKVILHGLNEVNHGNLGVTITIANQDEFGIVSSHFNDMTKNLRLANTELQNYAEKLEARVKKRTKDLNSKTNLLEIQTKELERMDKFRTKLFMNISHELRTPLTLISGPIDSLLLRDDLTADVEQKLKISQRNSNRLKQLVEQILDLNRLESEQLVLRISKIDVPETLTFFSNSFQSLFDYNQITFQLDLPKENINLYADADKLEIIITNLITNAVKFTPKGGSIQIKCTCTSDIVQFVFKDTGVGIPPDKLHTIFNRFETSAKESADYREGLGLGLSITKEYIELHEGSIKVESEINKGTVFTITFKRGNTHFDNNVINSIEQDINNAEYSQNQPSPIDSVLSEGVGQKEGTLGRILLVEDNYDMGNYIRTILQQEGYTVTIAENGQVALELLATVKPDFIISDIMMPVMDGMAFMKKLKSIDAYKNLPTIFLTARSDQEGLLDSLRIGVNDYLIKPFNTTELLCRVENLLEFSQSRQQFLIELSEEEKPSIDQQFIKKLTLLVEERMSRSTFNVEELANEVAMSRSTLYREIKRATGFSAAAFVKEIRLQKARQMLEAKTASRLNELSDSIGFSTPNYFAKMYFNRFGKSPKDYFNS